MLVERWGCRQETGIPDDVRGIDICMAREMERD